MMESGEDGVSMIRSCLTAKLRNIDGKILGKDGKPMQVYRRVQFDGSKQHVEPLCNDASHAVSDAIKNKLVCISELRSDKIMEGAALAIPLSAVEEVSARFENTLYGYFISNRLAFPLVENYVKNTWARFGLKRIMLDDGIFLFQFDTKEGMERIIENGPWLIQGMPLILNVWTPSSALRKEEIKKAPVWVKMNHVPIAAYSEVGLSLITTQIGCPIMLDSYTSNMCVRSWGKNEYAMSGASLAQRWNLPDSALIEVSADRDLMESIVIAILLGKGKGHTLATIEIEYEWKPPVCSICKIFDPTNDKCPNIPSDSEEVDVEIFMEDDRRKQVDSIRASTPNDTARLKFTWNQKPKGKDEILKKLDCVLTNLEFNDLFQGAHAIFQPYRISDHSSAILKIPWQVAVKPKPFKFVEN
nr:hypothetical protein [Tanacetum cinerariifolium]